ncbi:MAG: hypothetical protein Q4B86_07945 [Eubacteriales bacterium]|nr:hypothetical protein [Eubacteriales bacterium]
MKKLIVIILAILYSFNIISFAEVKYKYNMISEDEYTEDIWNSFYNAFPEIADEEKKGLKAGYNKEFLSYYSMTMEDYEEGNIFGGWEITEPNEADDSIVNHGVYAYGTVGNDTNRRWHRLTGVDAKPFYGYFYKHNLSAEVIGANAVRIHIDMDMSDNAGGESGKCTYQLSPDPKINSYSHSLQNPWIQIKDKVSAYRGTVTTLSFSSVGSSSPDKRRLQFKGYWDLSGDELKRFKELCTDNNINWAAGFKEEGSYSMNVGKQGCTNLASSINMALCSHTQKRAEQIAGDEVNHNLICTQCKRNLGKEKHGAKNELSRCPSCSYQFNVSGNVICQYNGYTKNIEYSMKPGAFFTPPETKGYLTPGKIAIPERGGDIKLTYEPIRYRIRIGDKTTELKYDETHVLERINRKGMIHEAYMVD